MEAEAAVETAVTVRPRLEARRRAFLEAATEAFLEKGYANTTLDDIIARSGGSRQTLYALFGGKQGLFEALLAERCREIFAALRAEGLPDRMPEDAMLHIGTRYLSSVTTRAAIGVYRLVVAEGVFMPELAERFWTTGPAHTRALLAAYFADQVRRGTLRLEDPEQAAHQFCAMLLGSFQMQCLLGLREAPSPAEIDAHVRSTVSRFLDGCRGDGVPQV